MSSSSSSRIDLIKHLFQIIDAQDWLAIRQVFAEQIVYDRPGYPRMIGIERVLYFYQHERVLRSGKHSLDHILVDNDRGSCWGWFVGHKKDGTPVEISFADAYDFDEPGRIRLRRSFFFQPAV